MRACGIWKKNDVSVMRTGGSISSFRLGKNISLKEKSSSSLRGLEEESSVDVVLVYINTM